MVTTGERTFGSGHLFVDDVVQVPVSVPVNVSGNTVDVIGVLTPAFEATYVND